MISYLVNSSLRIPLRYKSCLASSLVMTDKLQLKNGRPFTVFVEGNIGSGKTTFLNLFSNADSLLLSEPVDLWRNARGHNLLELMYESPSRWGMTFQSYVQLTMLKMHLCPTTKPLKVMERSLFSARYCFVENLYKQGMMTDQEYVVLDEWFRWIASNLNIGGDLMIYLRTEPEVVHERVKARSRKEEDCVSVDYLRELHNLHEKWIYSSDKLSSKIPVIVLDANRSLIHMEEEFQKCMLEIQQRVSMQEFPVVSHAEGHST